MQFLDQIDQLLELQLLDKNIEKCQLLEFKKVESLEHVRQFGRDRSFDRITFFQNSSLVLSNIDLDWTFFLKLFFRNIRKNVIRRKKKKLVCVLSTLVG